MRERLSLLSMRERAKHERELGVRETERGRAMHAKEG